MASRSRRRRRDASSPSLTVTRLPSASLPLVSRSFDLSAPLSEVEDRRTYHPLGPNRPARYSTGTTASYTLKDRKHAKPHRLRNPFGASQTRAAVAFADPSHVAVCVRRKTRREVIFASGAGAKRTKRRRPQRRSATSAIRC